MMDRYVYFAVSVCFVASLVGGCEAGKNSGSGEYVEPRFYARVVTGQMDIPRLRVEGVVARFKGGEEYVARLQIETDLDRMEARVADFMVYDSWESAVRDGSLPARGAGESELAWLERAALSEFSASISTGAPEWDYNPGEGFVRVVDLLSITGHRMALYLPYWSDPSGSSIPEAPGILDCTGSKCVPYRFRYAVSDWPLRDGMVIESTKLKFSMGLYSPEMESACAESTVKTLAEWSEFGEACDWYELAVDGSYYSKPPSDF